MCLCQLIIQSWHNTARPLECVGVNQGLCLRSHHGAKREEASARSSQCQTDAFPGSWVAGRGKVRRRPVTTLDGRLETSFTTRRCLLSRIESICIQQCEKQSCFWSERAAASLRLAAAQPVCHAGGAHTVPHSATEEVKYTRFHWAKNTSKDGW